MNSKYLLYQMVNKKRFIILGSYNIEMNKSMFFVIGSTLFGTH